MIPKKQSIVNKLPFNFELKTDSPEPFLYFLLKVINMSNSEPICASCNQPGHSRRTFRGYPLNPANVNSIEAAATVNNAPDFKISHKWLSLTPSYFYSLTTPWKLTLLTIQLTLKVNKLQSFNVQPVINLDTHVELTVFVLCTHLPMLYKTTQSMIG